MARFQPDLENSYCLLEQSQIQGQSQAQEKFQSHDQEQLLDYSEAQDFLVKVSRAIRWQVMGRLRELDICCDISSGSPIGDSIKDKHCSSFQKEATDKGNIWVKVSTPTQAILVWNVVRQFNCDRLHLAKWLDSAWYLNSDSDVLF